MSGRKISRREMLRLAALGAVGAAASACAPATPQIIRETVVVEKQVEVPVGQSIEGLA